MNSDDDIYDFLEHHGVKGMKWGVRNEDKPSGGSTGKTEDTSGSAKKPLEFSETEKAVVNKLAPHGYTEERMRKMYGPGSPGGPPPQERHLTEGQKKALKIGVGVAVGGLALYGLKKYGINKLVEAQLGPDASEELKNFWRDSQFTKAKIQKGYSKKFVENLSTEPVHLSAGSILKRISTEKETTINADGFFAAYKKEDVDRYKAVLPIYWKAWGIGGPDKGGHVVNLKAKTDINAPSPRKTFDMFVEFLGSENKEEGLGRSNRQALGHLLPPGAYDSSDNESYARKIFHMAAAGWNDNENPVSKGFINHAKSQGFNALVDMNDAGTLGDSPLRLFNGSDFEISGHETLTPTAIRQAQNAVLEIAHAISEFLSNYIGGVRMTYDDDIHDFLEHFGVAGMHWGVRKDRASGVSKKTDRDARKDATEFARAKAFFGTGAGTRRKLIKQTVEAKSKRDPDYKKAFDHHLSKQDQSKHVEKATSQRKRIDRTDKTKKSAGFLARKFTGEMGTQAAFTAAALAGAAFMASPKGRSMGRNVMNNLSDAKTRRRQAAGAAHLADVLSRMQGR